MACAGNLPAKRDRSELIYVFTERSQESNAPGIEEMQPREALLELVKKTYMNWLLGRERRAEEFNDLCKVDQDPTKISCELILADAARHSSRVAVLESAAGQREERFSLHSKRRVEVADGR